jgi:hypothetical protein
MDLFRLWFRINGIVFSVTPLGVPGQNLGKSVVVNHQ